MFKLKINTKEWLTLSVEVRGKLIRLAFLENKDKINTLHR
ncbi:transposase [Priestia megaterium]